ncbi:methylated-DNA--[protein]-cysteine S-methyltransferase [Acinetobacter sp.]|uniref:methylated-DNA--[protein]-cysteine S-methyltransferase n=1 Tax=Acinetobacter sp. TaxID=472 RepID=UPI0031D7F9DA
MMSENTNYIRVAKAIEYISQNFKEQPSLSEIAEHIHLSQAHFQRVFTAWAGISPKKFLQYISLEHAKSILKNNKENSVLDAAFDTGLSSISRLHDLFIQIEGMSPAEYKNGGESLQIHYSFSETRFGLIIIASTAKGICHMAFTENHEDAFSQLQAQFPNAKFVQQENELQRKAMSIFQLNPNNLSEIKLHLKGTEFQLKVWESLLKIPMGELTTYSAIAKGIGNNKACRAVGTAIGSNPVAFLIPCHRVIQSSGHIGGYMWGTTRKTAIIGWEGAKTHATDSD